MRLYVFIELTLCIQIQIMAHRNEPNSRKFSMYHCHHGPDMRPAGINTAQSNHHHHPVLGQSRNQTTNHKFTAILAQQVSNGASHSQVQMRLTKGSPLHLSTLCHRTKGSVHQQVQLLLCRLLIGASHTLISRQSRWLKIQRKSHNVWGQVRTG